MNWWGWGTPDEQAEITSKALKYLADRFGLSSDRLDPSDAAVALDSIELPDSALGSKQLESFKQIVGSGNVATDRDSRVFRSAGKSYIDLLNQRAGRCESAPDAVIYPETEEQIAEVLKLCSKDGVAVVPFGGGTSVVGGVNPVRGKFNALISLDLRRLGSLGAVDKQSMTATFGPGLTGPKSEAALNGHGLTLGHFPQSYEYATVGGWVATRSAGQASAGYGRIDKLVKGMRCVTPIGVADMRTLPGTAAGPDLRQVFTGSEGVFGVITSVDLQVAAKPKSSRYEAWFFDSFDEGADALRELEQEGVIPTVARLSDEQETEVSLTMSDKGRVKDKVGSLYLKARGYRPGALAIFGWDGQSTKGVQEARAAAIEVLDRHGCSCVGQSAGDSWLHGRYGGPFLRDVLMNRKFMVETLETATQWSNVGELYRAVKRSVTGLSTSQTGDPIIMCHISHVYKTGASLYFTFIAPQIDGAEIDQWRSIKAAVSDALIDNGGTITHHHAVGADHSLPFKEEVGDIGVEVLKAIKDRLDPAGVLNPGKLVS